MSEHDNGSRHLRSQPYLMYLQISPQCIVGCVCVNSDWVPPLSVSIYIGIAGIDTLSPIHFGTNQLLWR